MRTSVYSSLMIVFSLLITSCTFQVNGQTPSTTAEIHCKHFFYGYPAGTPSTNDLIIRDIYALSSNDDTKMADWVAYRLNQATVEGEVQTTRNWKVDPWLDDNETLEPADYNGAYAGIGVDRGHQAPLASFKGTDFWKETNYLSNITPQKSALNQGPWRFLEDKVRNLVMEGHTVYIMTGPLYERSMPGLPNADETHKVPSGYWKIVLVQDGSAANSIKSASFIFDQETPGSAKVIDHLISIDAIEGRSGLDFLWELPDELEDSLEQAEFREWAEQYFR